MVRKEIKNANRIVIKIGSSSLTHEKTGHIHIQKVEKFVRQIADLKNMGKEIIVVSSGAGAVGKSALNLEERPTELPLKQAIASVGQASLMTLYQKLFREYNYNVGQILLTRAVVEHSEMHANAVNTIENLLKLHVIPIVNENDTIATEEIEFGDNDNLSAIVGVLASADLVIILSDIDGLFTEDPRTNNEAKIIHHVEKIDHNIMEMSGDSISKVGTGGMRTKITAAKYATKHGVNLIIANSNKENILYRICDGEIIGTLFQKEI